MKTFSIHSTLFLALAFLGLSLSSCNKDKSEDPQPQVVENVRDLALGNYNYEMEWQDISTGEAVDVDGVEVVNGTFEVRRSAISINAIELWEDGELFFSFDDVFESPEGFSFNQSWLQLPYEGETYSFFPYDIFPMDGTTEAGVYYKDTGEFKFSFFVEIEGSDLTLTFSGQKN
ncbi:MAG: hypothetical protein AAGJ93_16715 [Bacteroidota bacterium]